MEAKDDNLRLWRKLADSPSRFYPTHHWHAQIQQYQFRSKTNTEVNGFLPVFGFTANGPLRVHLKKGTQSSAENFMVIR